MNTNAAIDLDTNISKAARTAAVQGRTIYVVPTHFGFRIVAEQPRSSEKWAEVTPTGAVTFRDTYAEFKARHGVA